MSTHSPTFTGRHMLLIMLAFFGVVIAVNVLNAVVATRSFTGLLAENGYVASLDYAADEAERRHADALGWTIRVATRAGVPAVTVTGADGQPVALRSVTATVEPATGGDPVPLPVERDGAAFRATAPLDRGNWIVRATVATVTDHVTKRAVVMVK